MAENKEKIKEIVMKNGESHPVYFRPALGTDTPKVRYTGFRQETLLLRKGSFRSEGCMPLPCDIILDRDTVVVMRDGVKIYTDVFRPADNGRHPVIVAWSPYGKEIGGWILDDMPGRAGVPTNAVSGLQKFEGPDPAYWVSKGYVVLNPDIRGAYKSEGDLMFWSHQQALDGYDFIEWAAGQPWSNGKVGMSGNSWLAMSQWMIAAENPPHLAAIAPWEGSADLYREITTRGGIPTPGFVESVIRTFCSDKGMIEDMPRMTVEYPLFDNYWEDKAFDVEKIDVPAYIVASYTSLIHVFGTFESYRKIASEDKWLRVHLTNEWPDYYLPEHENDLCRFFDRYLKGEKNGWEQTPHVRLSLYGDSEKDDIVDMPRQQWPIENSNRLRLHLDAANNSLSLKPVDKQYVVTYGSEDENHSVNFDLHFDEDTKIAGYIKLRVWVEADGNDDMDLGATLRVLTPDGKYRVTPFGPVIAEGRQRVSLRATDPVRSTEDIPFHTFTTEQKLKPGEVVPVDICIWPMGWNIRKGDTLHLTVGACDPTPMVDPGQKAADITVAKEGFTFMPGEDVEKVTFGGDATYYPFMDCAVSQPLLHNRGKHKIYTGGKYDSYLNVTIIK